MPRIIHTGNEKIIKVVTAGGPWAGVLVMAYIGAVVYFFQLDPTFWGFVLSLIKALFWPAFVLFEVLGSLGVA